MTSVAIQMDTGALRTLTDRGAYTVMSRVGPQIAGRARSYCPVDTGYLRSTIGWRVSAPPSPVLSVYATAYYAVYVHEGTRRMRPRPFLRDAIQAQRVA